MGRKKIEIEPLPDSQIKAKFKKRKSGLIKKAYELGTLCGAQVALIIFSKDGEEVVDKGYNATVGEIIQRYWNEVYSRNQQVPQQPIPPALQVPQFLPNSDSSSTLMDPRVQQEFFEVKAMDPNLQHDQYGMNPQGQQDQYGMNPQGQQDQFGMYDPQGQQDQYGMDSNLQVQQNQQFTNAPPVQLQEAQFMDPPPVQQDRYMNSQTQQAQFLNSQAQQEVPTDPRMQRAQFLNSQAQQEVPTDPRMQRAQFLNSQAQQEVPTDPRMPRAQFVDARTRRQQQSMTGSSQQMQQGIPYSMGTNFVGSSGNGNFVQDMAEGNQQFRGQGHQTQFQNRSNVRYANSQPSEPGYRN